MQFLRTTLFGGIFFLIPVIALVVIVGKALAILHKIVDPLATHLPIESVIGLRTPMLLAIVLLVALCFLAGLYARTSLAQKSVRVVEDTVLKKVPGYALLKNLGESLLGIESEEGAPVLVRFDDAWQIGIRVSEPADGHVTVFIPDAPNPQSGSVLFVSVDRVVPAKVPIASAMKSLKHYGAGSESFLAGIPRAESQETPPA